MRVWSLWEENLTLTEKVRFLILRIMCIHEENLVYRVKKMCHPRRDCHPKWQWLYASCFLRIYPETI